MSVPQSQSFNHLTIIGLGLIGGSIARAVKAVGLSTHVTAYDASEAVRDRVRELGLADTVAETLEAAVADSDCVILCTPVGTFEGIAQAMAPHLKPGAIVSDVGSTKGSAIAAVAPHLPEQCHLVPAHPVAGTENSGPDAGFATLFKGRWCIVTPPEGADETAVARVCDFWTALGSNVEVMDAQHHDRVLAVTSHIPHLIAYTIVGTASDLEQVTESEVIKFSAGGFRDFTRIAASDPTMWRDVFLNNREAVLEILQRFNEDLTALQRAIRWGDGDALFNLFSRTRHIRRTIIDAGQDTARPDFGRETATPSAAGTE
ncbi:prephenate/arogenate dehydrogenase family protein [Pedomonas mirosovicensis]|uniref:prephenate/arogenate dehydrogenase family protein n=1 Tax=Pedomonas mirosovicensis TaxID=2908641 RepID=UPI0021675A97|nr:prephenate/arogenate dehydrogenase family protein [Pedomonas mirosovicensis]MCH8684972.1 prephenate/arogenate dehydrogenase family protein [Pedomonas mirosovicensis]